MTKEQQNATNDTGREPGGTGKESGGTDNVPGNTGKVLDSPGKELCNTGKTSGSTGREPGGRAYRIWVASTLAVMVSILAGVVAITVSIDPFFHYHGPLANYAYPISNQRYQNDGITKHFQYDGIITGTSMTENFKTSEADQVFGANFIKVPFSGARYKEINDNLKRAYDAGKSIRYVIRCLDYSLLFSDKDEQRSDVDYPNYLYNDDLFDDMQYVLNKSVLINHTLNAIRYTITGRETTTFDVYSNWNKSYHFGAETVLGTYTLGEPEATPKTLSEEERERIRGNIRQNVTDLADAHPETTFYLFFSPYSICYYDSLQNAGELDWRIDGEAVAIEELLKHPNIKLYSFTNRFGLICDLNNYKDQAHYGEWVNSWILEWMKEGRYLLTQENYREYLEDIREFLHEYDYSSLRK